MEEIPDSSSHSLAALELSRKNSTLVGLQVTRLSSNLSRYIDRIFLSVSSLLVEQHTTSLDIILQPGAHLYTQYCSTPFDPCDLG